MMSIRRLRLIKYLCKLTNSKFILFTTLISTAVLGFYFANSYAVISIKDPNLSTEIVTQGLNYPTAMAFLNPDEILVTEKDLGKVIRIVNNNNSNNTVLTVNTENIDERGLKGMVLDKELAEIRENETNETEYVFLFYYERTTEKNTTKSASNNSTECKEHTCLESQYSNRLYRYEYKDGKLVNPKLLLDIPIYWNNRVYPTAYAAILKGGSNWLHYPLREGIHQGGKLAIGPDKNIYLVTGDGGGCLNKDGCYRSIKNGFLSMKSANKINGTDPVGMGGILRITGDGKIVGDKGILGDKIPIAYYYAYGIRNSFGLDFDPVTGKLWDTENGPAFGDEINLVEDGFNSGWAKIQGIWPVVNYTYLHFNSTERAIHFPSDQQVNNKKLENFDGKGTYSDPEFTWNASVGVTSIKFLDTDKYGSQYKNDILVGDAYGRIYHFDLNKNRTGLNLTGSLKDKVANSTSEVSDLIFGEGFDTITDMQIGPDGYLYVLSYTGKITKVIPKNTLE